MGLTVKGEVWRFCDVRCGVAYGMGGAMVGDCLVDASV